MKNIYKFTKEEVSKVVPDKKGIYFLGDLKNNNFIVGYVGRSDFSLKKRLMSHNHFDKFKFFCFQTTNTMKDAFFLETEYCYLLKDSTINKIHPNKPASLEIEYPGDTLARVMKKRFSGGLKNA